VFLGELRDGDRVPQREISKTLGVSLVPVREAVASLHREGVVTIEPHRGAFVNGLDAGVVREQFLVYGRIYGLAVGNLTRRNLPSVVAKLRAMAEEVRHEQDLDALLAKSIELQMLAVENGGSKRLRALLSPIWRMVPGNVYVTIPGSAQLARERLPEMVARIEAGDAEQAERACWRLLDDFGELVAIHLSGADRSHAG